MTKPQGDSTLALLESIIDEDATRTRVEFTELDCRFLLEQYNVKIVRSSEGEFLCYHGVKIGLGGRGPTGVSAFLLLLGILKFKRDKTRNLSEDLAVLFQC